MATSGTPSFGRGLGLRVGAFVAAMFGSAWVITHFPVGWLGTLLIMLAVGGGGTVMLVRFVGRHSDRVGSLTPALRRYNRRMLFSTFAYILTLFTATYAYKVWHPQGASAWLVALLPSLGVAGMFWAMARLLYEETDEYVRFKVVQQMLFGAGFLLVLATIWGFFEQFRLVPHVPSWAAMPVFAVGMGLSSFTKVVRG